MPLVSRCVMIASLALSVAAHTPGTIQLQLSNNLPRNQAVTIMQGPSRSSDTNNAHLQSISTRLSKRSVEMGLHSGSGSHTVQVTVGDQPRELIIDTGSGKTAFVCAGCNNCGNHRKHLPFVLTANTTYLSCDHSMTLQSMKGEPPCMACEHGKCKYSQTYVEGDYWTAYRVSDILGLSPSFETRIEFGCIYEQTGVFLDQPSDGIMGFSRHPDAIYEQFYRHKVTQSRIFSQCLTETGGFLTIGGVDLSRHTEPIRYTPLRNTGYQYWSVTLLDVSIGDRKNTLTVDRQNYNTDRGCVLDSGTTFLYMPESMREAFRLAWSRAIGNHAFIPLSDSFYSMTGENIAILPDICFWFLNSVHICIPSSRYFAPIGDGGVYMGTIFFVPGPKTIILGASVLEGNDVIYDVDNHRIGIAKADCDLPLQTEVDLSLDPGGDKFQVEVDYSQWMFVGVTFLALIGLVNAIWIATATKEELKTESSIKLPTTGNNCDEFSFFLMQDTDYQKY